MSTSCRVEAEQVPAGGLERRLALGLGGQPDGLHRVDPERLDDRLPAVHAGEHTARRVGRPRHTAHMAGIDHAPPRARRADGDAARRRRAGSSRSGSAGRCATPTPEIEALTGRTVRELRDELGTDAMHDLEAEALLGRWPTPGRTSSAPRRRWSTARTASRRSAATASPWRGSPSRPRPRRSASRPAPIGRGTATTRARSSPARRGSGSRRSGRWTRSSSRPTTGAGRRRRRDPRGARRGDRAGLRPGGLAAAPRRAAGTLSVPTGAW